MNSSPCTEQKHYAFNNAPRCGARTKRYNGRPCRCPAVRNKKRCRFHGGGKGSGGQPGNTNALKNGLTTAAVKGFRKSVKQILKQSLQFTKDLSNVD